MPFFLMQSCISMSPSPVDSPVDGRRYIMRASLTVQILRQVPRHCMPTMYNHHNCVSFVLLYGPLQYFRLYIHKARNFCLSSNSEKTLGICLFLRFSLFVFCFYWHDSWRTYSLMFFVCCVTIGSGSEEILCNSFCNICNHSLLWPLLPSFCVF